jgi:hypothetical protein
MKNTVNLLKHISLLAVAAVMFCFYCFAGLCALCALFCLIGKELLLVLVFVGIGIVGVVIGTMFLDLLDWLNERFGV